MKEYFFMQLKQLKEPAAQAGGFKIRSILHHLVDKSPSGRAHQETFQRFFAYLFVEQNVRII